MYGGGFQLRDNIRRRARTGGADTEGRAACAAGESRLESRKKHEKRTYSCMKLAPYPPKVHWAPFGKRTSNCPPLSVGSKDDLLESRHPVICAVNEVQPRTRTGNNTKGGLRTDSLRSTAI